MKLHSPYCLNRRRQSGLTLVEMLVSSALMLFILLGLTLMFGQTQRAFQGGTKQIDVLEGGRAALDLIVRDLEQMADSGMIGVTNFFVGTVNNALDLKPGLTNEIQDLYFLTHYNREWHAVGYSVKNTVPGVGSLYRYDVADPSERPLSNNRLFIDYGTSLSGNFTNFNRIIDGVIHFKIRAADASGVATNASTIGYSVHTTNSLPHYVDVELGILEPRTLEQARGMGNASTAFLQQQVGKIHIFRQQVPIRNAPR